MSWTDERVETLKKMWAEGQSASQIAKELGGVTRNAVIGKVHRLGLSNRAGSSAPAPEKKPAKPAPKKAAAKPAEKVVEVTVAPRKPIVPAGQPLPAQPSANEISPEAHRRPGNPGLLVLRTARETGQALLRGACGRRLPADVEPAGSSAVGRWQWGFLQAET